MTETKTTSNPNSNHDDFYRKLRKKIVKWAENQDNLDHKWADLVLIAPDLFHLLVRLSVDPDVPLREKGKLAAAIAYFVSPLDLMPELFLGPPGFLDDIVLSAYALNSIINNTSPEIVTRHWAGEKDVLILIQNILLQADAIIGSGLFKKLRKVLK